MLETDFTPIPVPRLGETPLDLSAETERARDRGYADGFAQGLRSALERGELQQAAELDRMRQSHAAHVRERDAAVSAVRASQDALEERIALLSELSARRIEALAVELAAAILGAELADPARAAAHALRRALEQMPISRWVSVTFDEADARTLQQDPDAAATLSGIEVVAAPGLGAGSAIVEIEAGAVDARIAEALARAVAALDGDDDPPTTGGAS